MKNNCKSLLLLLAVFLCVCPFISSVKAEEQVAEPINSSYSLTLPKSIDMGTATTKGFNYRVDGNIEEYEEVNVTVDKTYALHRINDNATSVNGNASISKTNFNKSDIASGTTATGNVASNPTKAGSYTGNVVFNTAIKRREGYSLITYNANGGTMIDKEKYVPVGQPYGILPTPTKKGHTFKGWYTSSSGGTQVNSNTVAGNSDVSIYAQWSVNFYNLTLDGNGASFIAGENVEPTYEYISNNYQLDDRGGIHAYANEATFTSLYATSSKFQPNTAYEIAIEILKPDTTTFYPSNTGNPTFGGYDEQLEGSWVKKGNTYTYRFNTPDVLPSNRLSIGSGGFYFKTDGISVTGEEVGRISISKPSVDTKTEVIEYGQKLDMLPTLTRTGYTFKGWYTSSIGGNKVTSDTTMIDSDTVFYAQWTKDVYRVSFELKGGTIPTGSELFYSIDTETLTLPVPTRDGYAFVGWTGSNGTAPQTQVSIEKGSVGNKIYYANWKKVKNYTASPYDSKYICNGNEIYAWQKITGSFATDMVLNTYDMFNTGKTYELEFICEDNISLYTNMIYVQINGAYQTGSWTVNGNRYTFRFTATGNAGRLTHTIYANDTRTTYGKIITVNLYEYE